MEVGVGDSAVVLAIFVVDVVYDGLKQEFQGSRKKPADIDMVLHSISTCPTPRIYLLIQKIYIDSSLTTKLLVISPI